MHQKGSLFILFVGLIVGCFSVRLPEWKSPPPPAPLSWGNTIVKDYGPSVEIRLQKLNPYILASASRYGLDPNLVRALIVQESGGNPYARSAAGAVGCCQFIPATAERFGLIKTLPTGEVIDQRTDPEACIEAGCKYLRFLINFMRPHAASQDEAVALALAGYNAGEGRVQKSNWTIPAISETQNYVARIMAMWKGPRPSSSNTNLEYTAANAG